MRHFLMILALVVMVCLSGCFTVGRWLAPIRPDELPAASQKILAAKDAEITELMESADEYTRSLEAEIEALKAAKAETGEWIFLGFTGLGLLIFVGSVFMAIWGDRKMGVAGGVAGLALIFICQTWLGFGDLFRIICAVGLAAILVMALIFGAFMLYRKLRGIVRSIEIAKGENGAIDLAALKEAQAEQGVQGYVQKVRIRDGLKVDRRTGRRKGKDKREGIE